MGMREAIIDLNHHLQIFNCLCVTLWETFPESIIHAKLTATIYPKTSNRATAEIHFRLLLSVRCFVLLLLLFFLCVRQIGICQCSKGKISRQNCWVAFHLLIRHIEASNKIRLLIWHFQQRKAIQKKISTAAQRARNANGETDNKRKQWNRRLFCFSTLTSVDGCCYSIVALPCMLAALWSLWDDAIIKLYTNNTSGAFITRECIGSLNGFYE